MSKSSPSRNRRSMKFRSARNTVLPLFKYAEEEKEKRQEQDAV